MTKWYVERRHSADDDWRVAYETDDPLTANAMYRRYARPASAGGIATGAVRLVGPDGYEHSATYIITPEDLYAH